MTKAKRKLDEVEYARFMIFSVVEYYPSGGLSDVVASFDTEQEAYDWLEKNPPDIGSTTIFDRVRGVTV